MREPTNPIAAEKRDTARVPTKGRISLTDLDDPTCVHVEAQLIDMSRDGLRVRHNHRGLRIGNVFLVRYPYAEVKARLIWSKESDAGVESGLSISSASDR